MVCGRGGWNGLHGGGVGDIVEFEGKGLFEVEVFEVEEGVGDFLFFPKILA